MNKKQRINSFFKNIDFHRRVHNVNLQESSFHAVFDFFARGFDEQLEEIKLAIVDRISLVNNLVEMRNIFNAFLRKRTQEYYKRSPDQWAELQRILESRLADLIDEVDPSSPGSDFFEVLDSGDSLLSKFISQRAAESLYSKALKIKVYLAKKDNPQEV